MTKAAPIAKSARPIDTSSVPAGNRIQVSPIIRSAHAQPRFTGRHIIGPAVE